jgi:hypothetical protein
VHHVPSNYTRKTRTDRIRHEAEITSHGLHGCGKNPSQVTRGPLQRRRGKNP